jgi:hypothetical protein
MIKSGILKSGTMVQDTVWMDMLEKKNIVLRNIYYDFDRWDILPASIEELDKLTAFMVENKEVKVELSSHTDSRGSIMYNQKLSERRAQSAVNYIISKGIDADRITAKGYGETMPLNKCIDNILCTPQESRMNRRTELYIPGFGKSEIVDQQGKGDYSTESAIQAKSKNKGKETSSLKDPGKCSVIVGSFTDLQNAGKIIGQLKNEGITAVIFSDTKFYKVGVGYKDVKSAREGLNKLKSKYPNAWILL